MKRVQILDYEGAPFSCRHFHKVGHLYKECPLLVKELPPLEALDDTSKVE